MTDERIIPPAVAEYALEQLVTKPLTVQDFTRDAENYGPALNEAGWVFIDECPETSALLFNNTKVPLRAAILKYAGLIKPAPVDPGLEDLRAQLLERIAEQAREIERLTAKACRLDSADRYVERLQADGEDMKIELAALKAQLQAAPAERRPTTVVCEDAELQGLLNCAVDISAGRCKQDDGQRFMGLLESVQGRLKAKHQAAPAERGTDEDWSIFFGYLIDKYEGHEIAEERLQGWLSEMIADPHYGALFRREKVIDGIPSPIALAIEAAEEEHGSLRAAAKALGIDPGYLSRLASGEKNNPSDEVLSALGLERVVSYRWLLNPAPAPSTADSDVREVK